MYAELVDGTPASSSRGMERNGGLYPSLPRKLRHNSMKRTPLVSSRRGLAMFLAWKIEGRLERGERKEELSLTCREMQDRLWFFAQRSNQRRLRWKLFVLFVCLSLISIPGSFIFKSIPVNGELLDAYDRAVVTGSIRWYFVFEI